MSEQWKWIQQKNYLVDIMSLEWLVFVSVCFCFFVFFNDLFFWSVVTLTMKYILISIHVQSLTYIYINFLHGFMDTLFLFSFFLNTHTFFNDLFFWSVVSLNHEIYILYLYMFNLLHIYISTFFMDSWIHSFFSLFF